MRLARGKRQARGGMPDDLPEGKKIVLHVGCGPRDTETLHERFRNPRDWHELRLDIDPRVAPDIVASIVDMDPVPQKSVDAVWSSHNLEHVYAHESEPVFREFFRVLRPGGQLLVTMPDLQRVAQHVAKGNLDDPLYVSESGPIYPLDALYGWGIHIAKGNDFMAHRTGYTMHSLAGKLRRVGFTDIRVRQDKEVFALWGEARRPA